MKFLILGAGGIGSYYGTKLLDSGHEVVFVARGNHLSAMQQNGLKLQHPKFSFHKDVLALSFDEIKSIKPQTIDAVLITTKSTTSQQLAQDLSLVFKDQKNPPFIVSLQNGVENEDIFSNFFPKTKIIGALTRKIGAHIIKPGVIEVTGVVETIVGSLEHSVQNESFIKEFSKILEEAGISCEITKDIKLELWKKLIINNGVNAICALLEIKTGVLMNDKKLSKIVYGLMCETATAARALNIKISNKDLNSMYELIKNFDSIKPSMLVDREFKREIELDEICGVVMKYNKKQDIDSPYTRTVSTLLEFIYNHEKE